MLGRESIKNYIPLTVPLYNLRDANTTTRSPLRYIRKQYLFIKKLGTETFAICPIHRYPLSKRIKLLSSCRNQCLFRTRIDAFYVYKIHGGLKARKKMNQRDQQNDEKRHFSFFSSHRATWNNFRCGTTVENVNS